MGTASATGAKVVTDPLLVAMVATVGQVVNKEERAAPEAAGGRTATDKGVPQAAGGPASPKEALVARVVKVRQEALEAAGGAQQAATEATPETAVRATLTSPKVKMVVRVEMEDAPTGTATLAQGGEEAKAEVAALMEVVRETEGKEGIAAAPATLALVAQEGKEATVPRELAAAAVTVDGAETLATAETQVLGVLLVQVVTVGGGGTVMTAIKRLTATKGVLAIPAGLGSPQT